MRSMLDKSVAIGTSATTPALTTTAAVMADASGIRTWTASGTDALTLHGLLTLAVGSTVTAATFKLQGSDSGAEPTVAASAEWTTILVLSTASGSALAPPTITGIAGDAVAVVAGTGSHRNFRYLRIVGASVTANAGANDSLTVRAVAS